MSHKADHPVAGMLWLVVAFGLIGMGSKAGIESSRAAQLEISKKTIDADLVKARAAVRAGMFDPAGELLEETLRAHPHDEYAAEQVKALREDIARERVRGELAAVREASHAEDTSKAEQMLAAVKAKYPDSEYVKKRAKMIEEQMAALKDSFAAIREAVAAGESGNFAQAEAGLKAVLEKHPTFTDALFNLAIAQIAQDREEEADKTLQKLLEIDEEDWDAVAERAGIKKRLGALDDAIAMLGKIPLGKGHVADRLTNDPLWSDAGGDGRIVDLVQRHGGANRERLDTTLRNTMPEPESHDE